MYIHTFVNMPLKCLIKMNTGSLKSCIQGYFDMIALFYKMHTIRLNVKLKEKIVSCESLASFAEAS